MISKEITICINSTQDCASLHVDWLGTEGLIIPCQDKNCITVAVDPDNPTQCLEGFIVCLDTNGVQSCKNCEPTYFRKCFCTLDSDCGVCGTCGPDGLCKDTCTPEQIAQGKTCYPDGCKCPPVRPVIDPKTGKCAECISGTKDPANPCRICVDGKWVTKSCGPDAVCDQSTGDCIDDCSKNTVNGKTRWNPVTKACDCESGYRWSTVKNTCVVDGDCKPGFRRNPVTDECDKITCPTGFVWSVEKNDCIKKPCDNTNCETGLDCTGVDCGCDETTKKCVNCTDNPNALGCKDDCDGEYCDDTIPCTKPGCTCVENKCVGCDNFPCDKCGLHEGCNCKDGVNCEGDEGPKDCLDKHELKFEDCSLKTKLELINSCNCDGVGTSLKVNHFSKAAGSTLNIYRAEFEIDLRKKFVNNITGYELLERFKQSDVTINNDFPDTANCSIEITSYYRDKDGIIFATPVQTLSSEIKTGAVGVKETFVKFDNVTIASDKPNDPLLPTLFVGYKLSVYVGNVIFNDKNCSYDRTKIYQTVSTGYESISLSNTPRYVTIGVISTVSKRNPILTIKRGTEIVRRLYVTPTSPGVYEDQINGPKKLSFYERGKQEMGLAEGELLSLRDYTTHWDCGCDKEKTLKQISKCDIKNWKNNEEFRIGTSTGSPICNNQLTLLKEHVPCYINQDLEYFGWGANHPSQTKYIVTIVDKKGATIVAGTFVYKNTTDTTGYFRKDGTNEQFIGFIFNHTEEITSVSIKMNHDTGCVLSDSVSLDLKDADVQLTCLGSVIRATISSRGSLIRKVEVPDFNIVSDTDNAGATQVILNNLPQNKDIKFFITYSNGCKKEQTHKKNCCESDSLKLSLSGVVERSLVIETENKAKLKSILINGSEYISKITENGNIYTILLSALNNPERVSVTVTTDNNCPYSISDFDCGESYPIDFKLEPNFICPSETSKLIVSGGPPNTEFIFKTPNGNTILKTTDTNGYIEVVDISVPGEYSVVRVGTQNITNEIPKVTLGVEASPIVHSLELEGGPGARCSDSDIKIIVRGTIGSLVDLEATKVGFSAKSQVKLDTPVTGSSGDGFGVATFTFSDQGTYTITSGKIVKGRCDGTSNKTVSVTVDQKVQIVSIDSVCQSPLGPNANLKVIVTLAANNYSGVTVTGKNLSDNIDITLINPTLPNVFEGIVTSGSGDQFEVVVRSGTGSCESKQTYKLNSCNCTDQTKPPVPVFNNYLVCLPGGSLNVTNSLVSGGQYAVDLYFNGSSVVTKRLTNTDSNYAITNSNQFGTYQPVSVNLLTGCTTNGQPFTVSSGDFILDDPNFTTGINYCAGSNVPLTATVSGGTGINSMLYKWFVNDVEQLGNNSANFVYLPTTPGSVTIKIEARRNLSNFTSGTVSQTCVKTTSKVMTVVNCCPPITLVYNLSESGQCSGITIDASISGGSPSQVFDYKMYSGVTLITSGSTTISNPSKIVIPNTFLAFGTQSYKFEVNPSGNPSCIHELNIFHNRCSCFCVENRCEATYWANGDNVNNFGYINGQGSVIEHDALTGEIYTVLMAKFGTPERYKIYYTIGVTEHLLLDTGYLSNGQYAQSGNSNHPLIVYKGNFATQPSLVGYVAGDYWTITNETFVYVRNTNVSGILYDTIQDYTNLWNNPSTNPGNLAPLTYHPSGVGSDSQTYAGGFDITTRVTTPFLGTSPGVVITSIAGILSVPVVVRQYANIQNPEYGIQIIPAANGRIRIEQNNHLSSAAGGAWYVQITKVNC